MGTTLTKSYRGTSDQVSSISLPNEGKVTGLPYLSSKLNLWSTDGVTVRARGA